MSEGNANPFHKGDRVRLKDSTRARFGVVGGNWPDEAVVTRVKLSLVYVRFDGRDKDDPWHESLIEHVEQANAAVPPGVAE